MLTGLVEYFKNITQLQTEILSQSSILDTIAAKMVETILIEKPIYLFGTGHSHIPAEEGFFRAGSLVNFVPILHSALMLHEGVHLSGAIERQSGLASLLLDRYQVMPNAMLFIFSNSGTNYLPVEMAMEAQKRQLTVVGITSVAYAQIAPLSALGKRLDEVADFVIDTHITPGDGLISLHNSDWHVAPASTVITTMILNGLVAEVARRLEAQNETIPILASQNLAGAAEHNQQVLSRWSVRNPHI